MKTHYTVAVALLAGIGVGAVAVKGLHAHVGYWGNNGQHKSHEK